MYPLTQILSPTLPQTELMAVAPDWTRADFNRAVFALSGRLKAAGVQTAALWFDDAAHFACALLAVWHAEAEAWLLPNLAQENTAWGQGADIWLTDSAALETALPAGKKVPDTPAQNLSDGLPAVWHLPEIIAAMPSETPFPAPEHTAIAPDARALLKTSGSSGAAQIIVKTAAQMEAEALVLAQTLPFAERGTAVAGSVSPQHMYGFTFRFALTLTLGWAMVRHQAVYPETLLAAVQPQGQTVWIASPAVLNRMGEARDWAAVQGRLAGIVSAGGALPESTSKLLGEHAVQPFEIYGSTETGVIAARRGVALWQPLAGVQLNQDADGALAVASPWTDGLWQSADVAEMFSDGFTLIGRKDRIVKFEDKRVSLTQIEHELLQHAWIADAHCGQHPHNRRIAVWAALNEHGIAALREQGRAAVADALKRHLAATQDKAALPRYWRFADSLPRNAQSKIAAAAFEAALTQAQTAPVWADRPSEHENGTDSAAPNAHYFAARVPLDLVYFGGHFAKFPLVPGVVELQWVRALAQRFAWGGQSIVRVENLKYQQFLRPHDEVFAELVYDESKNKLTFKLENAEAVCASGRIVFGRFEAVPLASGFAL